VNPGKSGLQPDSGCRSSKSIRLNRHDLENPFPAQAASSYWLPVAKADELPWRRISKATTQPRWVRMALIAVSVDGIAALNGC